MVSSDKMKWYVNRLRSMPRQEVAHRFKEAVEARRPFSQDTNSPLSELTKPGGSKPRLLDIRRKFWTLGVSETCLNQAKAVEAGTISVLGHSWSSADMMWHVDPVSGFEWPSVAARKIDYRHSNSPDPKWTWEVNRLLFLIPVAFAMESAELDRTCGEKLISETLLDWIANCKPGRGPQWAASIEVAIRSISMTLAWQAINTPNDQLTIAVGRSVRDHAEWIKRFPSVYSSANNHRVAEISALFILDASWAGILSPVEREHLEQEILEVTRSLFSRDGIGLEQSPTYAGFSLEFLSLVLHTYEWLNASNRTAVEAIVKEASTVLLQFTNEDGSLIKYGDDDEGKVVTVGVPETEYARTLAALAGETRFDRASGLLTYAEGGISLLRYIDSGAETTWLFDHGPLGFGEIAAHGHADVLSVSMRSDNVNWIVDAGTYRYHGDKKWRTYFRSSRAHNAPQLDEIDSSVMTGDFNWDPKKRAQGKLISSSSRDSFFRLRASHDGYRLQGRGLVWRTLERIDVGHYRIIDEHDSNSQLSTAFLIHPDCDVVEIDAGWRVSHPNSGKAVELTVVGESSRVFERPEQETAWFSPKFGSKVPTWRLGAKSSAATKNSQLLFNFVILDTIQQEANR